MINKNILSNPFIEYNSAIMDRISAFQISHNFSNLNLIKCFMQDVPTIMSKSFSFLVCH